MPKNTDRAQKVLSSDFFVLDPPPEIYFRAADFSGINILNRRVKKVR